MYDKCICYYAQHFHLIWKISDGFQRKNVQGALFSFTAHQFKNKLKKKNEALLEDHFVNKIDREYQFWQREPMVKNAGQKNSFNRNLITLILILASLIGTCQINLKIINIHQLSFMKLA